MELIANLDQSQRLLTAVVESLRAGQLASTTPCVAWNFGTLLSHTLATVDAFSSAVDGQPGATVEDIMTGADWIGDDALGATKQTLQRSSAARSSIDDFDREVTTVLGAMPAAQAISILTFSNMVHTWDLAKALGRRLDLPDNLLQVGQAVAGQLVPGAPEGFFAPATEVPEGATPTDKLMALTGRSI